MRREYRSKNGDERVRAGGPRLVGRRQRGEPRPARLGSSPPAINKGVKTLKVRYDSEVGDERVALC